MARSNAGRVFVTPTFNAAFRDGPIECRQGLRDADIQVLQALRDRPAIRGRMPIELGVAESCRHRLPFPLDGLDLVEHRGQLRRHFWRGASLDVLAAFSLPSRCCWYQLI